MFCGQRIIKQGTTVTVHQDLCIEDLHEALIPKGKDTDSLVGFDLTEYRSVLGKLKWLQSRTQFHISYHFSRCVSASASATILDAKGLIDEDCLRVSSPSKLKKQSQSKLGGHGRTSVGIERSRDLLIFPLSILAGESRDNDWADLMRPFCKTSQRVS